MRVALKAECSRFRTGRSLCEYFGLVCAKSTDDGDSASSLGMMSEEEKKMQRIEDIKELLS